VIGGTSARQKTVAIENTSVAAVTSALERALKGAK
jgi:hypothetical protein